MRWGLRSSVSGFSKCSQSCSQIWFRRHLHQLPLSLQFKLQFRIRRHLFKPPLKFSGLEFRHQFRIRHQLPSTRHLWLALPWSPSFKLPPEFNSSSVKFRI